MTRTRWTRILITAKRQQEPQEKKTIFGTETGLFSDGPRCDGLIHAGEFIHHMEAAVALSIVM